MTMKWMLVPGEEARRVSTMGTRFPLNRSQVEEEFSRTCDQSEVISGSRDLVSTNGSSPPAGC